MKLSERRIKRLAKIITGDKGAVSIPVRTHARQLFQRGLAVTIRTLRASHHVGSLRKNASGNSTARATLKEITRPH